MSKRPPPKQDEDGKYLPNGASAKAGLNKSIFGCWLGSVPTDMPEQGSMGRFSRPVGQPQVHRPDVSRLWRGPEEGAKGALASMFLWLFSGSRPQCGTEYTQAWIASAEKSSPGSDGAFRGRASEKPPTLAVGSRHGPYQLQAFCSMHTDQRSGCAQKKGFSHYEIQAGSVVYREGEDGKYRRRRNQLMGRQQEQ